ILIKGNSFLDKLWKLNKIIFDKTGTLTRGAFFVKSIEIFDKSYTKDEIIEILVKGENLSSHPIAKSILKLTNKSIDSRDVSNFKEVPGCGISYTLNGKKVIIGTQKACNCNEIAVLHLNINDKHIASIDIDDGIKENAQTAIKQLKEQGIEVYMFTGDKKDVAMEIGKNLQIDKVKYEMLPTDKYSEYEKISRLNGTNNVVAFCGDGINDAPVLRRADIGISMGDIGSEFAIEASDIVLISDDLIKIPLAINISKYTKRIIMQNLCFTMLVKVSILILSILGLASMWSAVFADTGVTLVAILNTLRILNKFKK
ncbi:MAG: HAD-IC family P-type ATPase, partial [Clostridia bacterium]|nr:HAD-IC family P-type ATPase [Clostridia bacterium]